jgi:hypothetical protein
MSIGALDTDAPDERYDQQAVAIRTHQQLASVAEQIPISFAAR